MGSLRGRYMLDCNRIDFRFIRLQAAGRLGRLGGRQAWPVGLLQEASSVWWHGQQRQAAGSAQRLNCAHFLGGGHCTKICTDARLEIMKLESLKFGKQEWESIWGSLYCVQLFFSTLIHWHFLASFWQQTGILFYLHFFFWHWIFDDVTPFEKHSKGGVILSRSSQSWENLKFDTMLTSTKLKVVRRSIRK
jgi:hypothetical protein